MRIESERLQNGGRLEWGSAVQEGDLRVVLGGGRGCMLHGERLPAMVVLPLRGRVQVSDTESTRLLAAGDALVVETGQSVQVIGRGSALWLALRVPAGAWRAVAGDAEAGSTGETVLLPAVHAADRGLRRAGVRLVREAAAGNDAAALAAATAFASLLAELQSGFQPLVARCPGRTHAQRRNVFLRLLRVRNYMAASCQLDLGIDDFARMASYSPCHFIRAFNAVFGDTPHAVLVEQRLTRAKRLVDESSMAITEIARASGFENRCAFSRSFKRRFGVTATSLRERGRVAA
jgi:AraC family transcriptional regulator